MFDSYVHPHHSSYLSGARLAAKAIAPAKSFSFSLSDIRYLFDLSETGKITVMPTWRRTASGRL